jgi:hypothetical protein
VYSLSLYHLAESFQLLAAITRVIDEMNLIVTVDSF